MTKPDDTPDLAALAAACRSHHVQRLALFGSVATGQARPDSDVDVLVSFDLPTGESYLDAFFGLRRQLETIFGRRVDLVRDGDFRNPYFRAVVERQRRPLYP